jgi:hypothetical protein
MHLKKLLGLAAACVALAPAGASAQSLPPLDITKLDYKPQGFFKAGAPIPADYGKSCDSIKAQRDGKLFNPSGEWNSFDTTLFEYYCLPYRDQGDKSARDPDGNGGEPRYGYCKGANPNDPLDPGVCPNHQLEYVDYFKATMLEIFKDFGATATQYEFNSPDGKGINPAVIVPGDGAPDEHILIGSHYDQTKEGPASLWDSQEGHAEMIRVAKLMADYWKRTGTRPAATVKFVPMDGEEDGLNGSRAYVRDVVLPGAAGAAKVRAYFNADPCAGGYPARRYGNPADVIPINVQIGESANRPRVAAFNGTVTKTLEDVLTAIDDKITSYPDQPETFISTSEDPVRTHVGKHLFVTTERAVIFSSDWANFINAGIPIFNPSPKVTGPGNPGGSGPTLFTAQNPYPDGVIGFHTPIDNLQTMSRYTGADPLGNKYPEGYMKGMEFCSHLLAWGMLQQNAGGAQTATDAPVAYYEALPNEASVGGTVTFNAGGSYQYADVTSREAVDASKLQFAWDFGDGSQATGRVARHEYAKSGEYTSILTVTNTDTGAKDTMTIPVVVQ